MLSVLGSGRLGSIVEGVGKPGSAEESRPLENCSVVVKRVSERVKPEEEKSAQVRVVRFWYRSYIVK